ncbi:hypothetical protein RUM44_004493 [Polyplax serrata]|uniref:28S ribosomal protein S18c, mitochondrial n=1 Tax=Polyplax serrata TaxID=468196 RepID=A0ABR1B3R2_POLSC
MFSVQRLRCLKKAFDVLRPYQSYQYTTPPSQQENQAVDEDMPVEMESPFKKENPKCILCQYDIEPNFKNVRLLSQFVSRFTGRIYGRHITGLCKYKQRKVETEIRKAQRAALMPTYTKLPNFLADPSLYNESNPIRPHKYI